MLTYAQIETRILQLLQDSSGATYDKTTEIAPAIENELKRLSRYSPFLVDMIFQIESREGTDVTGTANALTDAVKNQFLTTDDDNEKVVHNITDDTWAVVKTATSSTSVLTLNKDIMDANEKYEIYNKRCRNKRQIYIGALPPYLWVEYVEYLGKERTFKHISRDIIELDVEDSTIQDSDSTLTTLESVDVLVRFAVCQSLCQLTGLVGAVHTAGAVGATTMQVKGLTDAEVVEVGDMFNIADHKTTYVIITAVTLANQASTGSTLTFYPGLEATTTADDVVTFVQSTLQSNHEDLLERMVISRAVQSDSILKIDAVNKGGPDVMRKYQMWVTGNPLLSPVLIKQELESLATPKKARICSRT